MPKTGKASARADCRSIVYIWICVKHILGPLQSFFLPLQPWIDRLAFQGQNAEDAFVDAAERFVADEAFEGLDT